MKLITAFMVTVLATAMAAPAPPDADVALDIERRDAEAAEALPVTEENDLHGNDDDDDFPLLYERGYGGYDSHHYGGHGHRHGYHHHHGHGHRHGRHGHRSVKRDQPAEPTREVKDEAKGSESKAWYGGGHGGGYGWRPYGWRPYGWRPYGWGPGWRGGWHGRGW